MKKWMISLIVLGGLLTGCGSSEWSATMQDAHSFAPNEHVPLTLQVQADGQPVSGLQIQGELTMQRMDHDTVEVEFKETSSGVYESNAELPMGGDWVANLKASKDGETQELQSNFKVPVSQAANK